MLPPDGRIRIVVEGVRPEIDGGAFPAKRVVGDFVTVEADILTDDHASVAAEFESLPAHIMKVRKWVRTERNFDYYF